MSAPTTLEIGCPSSFGTLQEHLGLGTTGKRDCCSSRFLTPDVAEGNNRINRSHELHRWHLCTSVLGTLLSWQAYATLLLLAHGAGMDAVVSACWSLDTEIAGGLRVLVLRPSVIAGNFGGISACPRMRARQPLAMFSTLKLNFTMCIDKKIDRLMDYR